MLKKTLSMLIAGFIAFSSSLSVSAASGSYTVKKGDTLSDIAQQHGVSWKELVNLNGLNDSYVLYKGRKLRIPAAGHSNREVKNIIMMIGDGMGVGQIELARLFEYGIKGRLFMQSLPNVALMQTYSSNNFVTDSAAAGTALATGTKTQNGMVGVTPEGEEVDSILDLFQEKGAKVGVISNNTVVDATPAAYTASVAARSSGNLIAQQMLENEYDVLLGGGARYFTADENDGVDLVEEFRKKGYAFVDDQDELAALDDAEKVLGLFHPEYMNYKQDLEEMDSNEPSLMEMQDKALDILSQSDDGFFLMVEGALIDHASHAADVPGVWKETIEFDKTVQEAVEWAEKDGETLVVVLADHETMGLAAAEPMDIDALKQIKVSPEYMAAQLKAVEGGTGYTKESVKDVFKTHASIDLTDEEVDEFNRSIVSEEDNSLYAPYKIGWEIGSIIAAEHHVGVMSPEVRALSDTGGHTGNMVPVFAYGPKSEQFEGILDNIDIAKLLSDIMDFDVLPRGNHDSK